MFSHIIPEVFQQRFLLVQIFWGCVDCEKRLLAIFVDILESPRNNKVQGFVLYGWKLVNG